MYSAAHLQSKSLLLGSKLTSNLHFFIENNKEEMVWERRKTVSLQLETTGYIVCEDRCCLSAIFLLPLDVLDRLVIKIDVFHHYYVPQQKQDHSIYHSLKLRMYFSQLPKALKAILRIRLFSFSFLHISNKYTQVLFVFIDCIYSYCARTFSLLPWDRGREHYWFIWDVIQSQRWKKNSPVLLHRIIDTKLILSWSHCLPLNLSRKMLLYVNHTCYTVLHLTPRGPLELCAIRGACFETNSNVV